MPEPKRERVLSNDEIAAIWQAAGEIGYPFGDAVKMLVLTGVRREEIFGLSSLEGDLEEGMIRLPAERSKTKEGRTIALSQQALALLNSLPRIGKGTCLFSFNGSKRFDNVGRAKPRLDKAIEKSLGRPIAPWCLHDVRRSVATGLQRLEVRLEVIEAVLGHVSGTRAGIVGTYQKHRFESEAKAALVAWGEHVASLINADHEATVVPFARKR